MVSYAGGAERITHRNNIRLRSVGCFCLSTKNQTRRVFTLIFDNSCPFICVPHEVKFAVSVVNFIIGSFRARSESEAKNCEKLRRGRYALVADVGSPPRYALVTNVHPLVMNICFVVRDL